MKRDTHRLRWIYVAVIALTPATISWIPFATDRYGLQVTICSIQTYNTETCQSDPLGIALLILLWWVPYSITFIITGPLYILILYRISREKHKYMGIVDIDRSIVYEQTVKEAGYVKWLPFGIFVFNLIGIVAVAFAYAFHEMDVGLWIVVNVIKGLQGLIIALPLALHPTTRRILNWNSFVAAWRQNILCRDTVQEYMITRAEHSDSVSYVKM